MTLMEEHAFFPLFVHFVRSPLASVVISQLIHVFIKHSPPTPLQLNCCFQPTPTLSSTLKCKQQNPKSATGGAIKKKKKIKGPNGCTLHIPFPEKGHLGINRLADGCVEICVAFCLVFAIFFSIYTASSHFQSAVPTFINPHNSPVR